MTEPEASLSRVHKMTLRLPQDVVLCRQRARTIAEAAGFDSAEQIRIAAAVSEVARNAIQYASKATAEFALGETTEGMVITISDEGPGLGNLADVLSGNFISQSGHAAKGLISANRLMDELDVTTGDHGTMVKLVKLPSKHDLQYRKLKAKEVTALLDRDQIGDPMSELATQNAELIRILEEVQAQRQEMEDRTEQLQQLSEELAETNRGVLALYHELDSLYRLGSVMASQIELQALIQAIIDATTELSTAEFGGFFYCPTPGGPLRCHAVAGILRNETLPWEEASCREIFAQDEVPTEVVRFDTRDERHLELLVSGLHFQSYLAVPVFDAAGWVVGAMIFGHRSPRHFGEWHDRILTASATQATVALEKAALYSSLQSANFAKDSFLATLSHELRTPLNPVFVILAELEGDQSLPEHLKGDLAVMRRNLDLEARLIDDLLDMTRIVQGKVNLTSTLVDMHELLNAVRQICQANILQKEITVEMKLEAGSHHVIGDATRLQQVFWNLLHNAIKFTPNGGRITIKSLPKAVEDTLVLEITDTGKGIDPAFLKHIFRPFEQGNVAGLAHYGGLGLGLAISKSVVEAHGGEISAMSPGEGHGATFQVKLRSSKLASSSASKKGDAALSTKPKPSTGQSLRILLVDDHSDTLSTLCRLLERRKHKVKTAKDAEEAIEIANHHSFDIVVSDIGLPGRNGLELMKELRDRHDLRGIALSGYGTEADIARSKEHGFFIHLIKPLNFAELEAALASVEILDGK